MKKKPLLVAAAALALTIGFLLWWFSDTQVLKRRTAELAGVFTIKADDGKAARLSKNQTLAGLLHPEFSCSVDLENHRGEHSKDKLIEAHLYLGQVCEASAVRIGKIEVVSVSGKRAEVRSDFSFSVRLKGGESYTETAPATLSWSNADGSGWKLRQVVLRPE